jgi:branched-chain amino acid transport system permease protein
MEMTWVFGQQMWNGVVTGIAYILFAMGLNMIFGMLGIINMAHGEVYMLGAMLFWTMTGLLHLNFLLSFVLAVGFVAIFGIIFNRIAIRPILGADPLIIMLSTMAISVILMYGSMITWNVDARSIETPFTGKTLYHGIIFSHTSVVLCAIGIISLICLHVFLKIATVGKAMRATAQDHTGANLVGINVRRIYAVTMALASTLAAIAGGIIGPIWVSYPLMGQDMLPKGFAIVVVSGLGNRGIGPIVITGLALGILEAIFSQYVSMYYRDAFAFGILLVTCFVRPQGLFNR